MLGLPSTGKDELDAVAVADKVTELVGSLGLKSTLQEYNVPHTEEEMRAIAQRATRTSEGEEFTAVVNIVKQLY